MIGVAVNWLLLMVRVLNNQNVGLRYANPTYPFFYSHFTGPPFPATDPFHRSITAGI
jgi:hypothetical protein